MRDLSMVTAKARPGLPVAARRALFFGLVAATTLTVHHSTLQDRLAHAEHLLGRSGVEISGRLVGDNDFGTVGKRPRQRHTLPLTGSRTMFPTPTFGIPSFVRSHAPLEN